MAPVFEQQVGDFIKANGLLSSENKVLLAVSGGADSTALLCVLQALSSNNILSVEFLCAHINHQIRGADADSDEDFVIAQARALKLHITTKRIDVRGFARKHKLSIETAARKLRIESLLEIARANNCSIIATAHHKNDNAETILQRLTRGTGYRGLGGIWPIRIFENEFKFIRPLLCVRRDEIIKYFETIFGTDCCRYYNRIVMVYLWSNYLNCLNLPEDSVNLLVLARMMFGRKSLIVPAKKQLWT